MKTSTRWIAFAAPGFLAAAAVAEAHPGHGGHELTWDFQTGFAHPFTGWDHLLAMVAVGWWAYQLGGRARWAVPGLFLGLLGISALVGQAAVPPPGLEQALAASVLVLGLLVATAARLPLTVAAVLGGAFAVFHGLAHGAEMPANTAGLQYGAGLMAASAALLGAGLTAGALTARREWPARFAGTALAMVGLLALAA